MLFYVAYFSPFIFHHCTGVQVPRGLHEHHVAAPEHRLGQKQLSLHPALRRGPFLPQSLPYVLHSGGF